LQNKNKRGQTPLFLEFKISEEYFKDEKDKNLDAYLACVNE
jgi:hypothetical protein